MGKNHEEAIHKRKKKKCPETLGTQPHGNQEWAKLNYNEIATYTQYMGQKFKPKNIKLKWKYGKMETPRPFWCEQ